MDGSCRACVLPPLNTAAQTQADCAAMTFVRELRALLSYARFRQLFAVRLVGQVADGMLQVALASYLLFSPERQPDAGAIAGALAAVLLPFTVLGPFTGVLLDRWSRRQVLMLANLARAVPVVVIAALLARGAGEAVLFVAVLLAFSVNRFLLAGLSAALPHVVETRRLVLANSIVPTSGTLAFMLGLAAAIALRSLPSSAAPTDIDADVGLVLVAAGGYLVAAALTARLPRELLGPDLTNTQPAVKEALRRVSRGLLAGLEHLWQRPVAAQALAVIAAHRFCYGLSTVATILLYRNYFNDPSDVDAGLAGLSVAVLVSGAGFFMAALLTPVATARVGTREWIVALLALAAVAEVFPGALYTEPALLVAAFALGVSAQGVKICVDTLVQTSVEDAFRGRVFSLYDVVFNAVFVAAAAVGAVVIPANGKSYAVLAAIAVGYAATAALYLVASRASTSG